DGVATYLAYDKINKNHVGPSFLTIFKDLKSKDSLQIEHIYLNNLRSMLVGNSLIDGLDVFIGQKLIQTNQVTKESYYRSIIAAQEKVDKDLIYVAHRGEDPESIREISRIPSVHVVTPDLPLE